MKNLLKKKPVLAASAFSVFILTITTVSVVSSNANIGLIVDGKEVTPDVTPQIIDGRVMVPVRWVSEAFDTEVEWDEDHRNVIIHQNEGPYEATTLEEKLQQDLPAPSEDIRFEDASDEEITAYLEEAGDWLLKSIFAASPTSGEDKAEQEKQAIFAHLSPLFTEDVIADYFHRGYKKEHAMYIKQGVDIQRLADYYDQHEVNVTKVEEGVVGIEVKATLTAEGIVLTHQSTVRYDEHGFVFESFNASRN
ncbi:copper amine oxidase N-terminal domain-containing protein [Bacillaceae bacterium SIJ1]|uniref:copper amine oxidase N-terminal domain-containing protein n=1 Tax=Litoribacterium kuwaitense TaxID=1398745 RepID=UPI0013EC052E|nr:copper amine oxidase N-terminal domain-containing protein [Litoribacterium kuwaitense]NGP45572.1 copper amine oxidase N-terminal domain-containing protein [Litoribacterium kuwaitense]